MKIHPEYRSDIDGLRAVAILSVVGFHAFPFWVKGGFVGVDIFFVISGFLISTIIFGNLERNTFSFIEFYSRRIKRIFPALLVVLIACFAFGWFALLADDYKQLGKHMAAGAGFASNIVLWNESGYFDKAAETKPLLHLWSLGIEEQFYIVWPLLLWFAWKSRFNLLAMTFSVVAVSFVLNVRGIRTDAVAAFYSPQTRFWELLVGSVLAWLTLHKRNVKLHLRLDRSLESGGEADGSEWRHSTQYPSVDGCWTHCGGNPAHYKGIAIPRMVGCDTNSRCCFDDRGRRTSLAEPCRTFKQSAGLVRADQLPVISLALAFTVFCQNS